MVKKYGGDTYFVLAQDLLEMKLPIFIGRKTTFVLDIFSSLIAQRVLYMFHAV